MIMVHSFSSYLLLYPSKFPLSATSPSQFFPFFTPFHHYFHASKSSHCTRFSWRSQSLPARHLLRVPPLCCTATEENVETSVEDLEFVEIGYVSDVHGLQGEIRVKHNTDFPELRLGQPGKRWLRQRFSGRQNVFEVDLVIGRGRPEDKSWIIKLGGFDDVDQARQLVGSTFLVNKSDRPELQEGDYYSRDLVGMRVILKDTGEAVGSVVNVFYNGGNDLLHVRLEEPTLSPSEETLRSKEIIESGPLVWIPFVEEIVPIVDMDKREMQISPPKGLMELNVRSNDKSKKERRADDWKERKKFQKRLMFAKKKLCELGQQHVVHGLKYGEKIQRSFLAEQIVSVNSKLLQQAIQAVEMANKGEYKEESITCRSGTSVKISEKCLKSVSKDELDANAKQRENGLHLISEGKVAIVLVLNNQRQEVIEADSTDIEERESLAMSRLESLLLDEQTFIKAEERSSVPIILISPAKDVQLLGKLFARYEYFNFNSEKVKFLGDEELPAVSYSEVDQKKNKILMKSPWEIVQSPIGSAGPIIAISSNNILDFLTQSGVEYVELCSINEKSLCGNPVFLGFVDSCKSDVGILTYEDENDFEDNFHIVLPMRSMKKLVTHAEKLSWRVELKSNSHVELIDKEWVDVIPSTPNSYEFHCSMASLLKSCLPDNVCLMEVTC